MIDGSTELDKLVNRSQRIGADPALVVHGGGNTSTKLDVDGGRVMRIKGSGTDLRTITADGFPGLHLDQLRPLRQRDSMSDEEMVAFLDGCMTEPDARKPSIETLLHGFLPAAHVDHVHADAICTLTNHPDGERAVAEALGTDIAIVPYVRPGFELSKLTADMADARAVVLDHHGLVTWGDSHEDSYLLTLELVANAQAYIDRSRRPRPAARANLSGDEQAALTAELAQRIDGVLHIDRTQRRFSDRDDVESVATAARATPDHILRIGAQSAVIRSAGEAGDVLDRFEQSYRAYFERHRHRLPSGLGIRSVQPQVVLVPGLGAIAVGADEAKAAMHAEIAYRSHLVTAQVLDTFGSVAWLNEAEIFDFDYWPLELRKLQPAV